MNKFALLIGVNKYNFLTPLNFTVQDVESTAEALKSCYGFRDDEICLIVGFWGHSFALKADERYLCAILTQEEGLVRTGLPLQQVIAEMQGAGDIPLLPTVAPPVLPAVAPPVLPTPQIRQCSC